MCQECSGQKGQDKHVGVHALAGLCLDLLHKPVSMTSLRTLLLLPAEVARLSQAQAAHLMKVSSTLLGVTSEQLLGCTTTSRHTFRTRALEGLVRSHLMQVGYTRPSAAWDTELQHLREGNLCTVGVNLRSPTAVTHHLWGIGGAMAHLHPDTMAIAVCWANEPGLLASCHRNTPESDYHHWLRLADVARTTFELSAPCPLVVLGMGITKDTRQAMWELEAEIRVPLYHKDALPRCMRSAEWPVAHEWTQTHPHWGGFVGQKAYWDGRRSVSPRGITVVAVTNPMVADANKATNVATG